MPIAFVVGDDFDVTLTIPGYKPSTASSATLAIFVSNRYGTFTTTITGTTSGQGWNFKALTAATATWLAGNATYNFVVVETVGGERVTIAGGWFLIQPNPVVAPASSHAAQMIALIEARLLNRVPRDLQSFTIGGQNIMKIPIEMLYDLRAKYREEVNAEQSELQRQMGQGTKRRILARFTSPSNIPASPFPYNPV